MNVVDKYISEFPKEVQEKLKEMRKIIKGILKDAEEKISYGMPSYYMDGPVVHFAGFKKHIGFFPTPGAIVHFKDQLDDYKLSKGTIQFPLDKEIPTKLVKDIVKYRLNEVKELASLKKK